MCGVFPKEGIGSTLKTDGVPCLQVNGEFPLHVQLDRACMRIPCKINLPREFFTNLNSESSFVLEPGCGESISGVCEVI